jgi:hypothetical protein
MTLLILVIFHYGTVFPSSLSGNKYNIGPKYVKNSATTGADLWYN